MCHNRALALLTVCVAAVAPSQVQQTSAADVSWQGGFSTDWNTGSNWLGGHVPSVLNDERGVVGSTDIGAAQDGVAEISSSPPIVGGIALGRDADTVGTLTISGGNVTCGLTNDAAEGADGRVLVGVDGRGYLSMTGGTLNATGLVVAGEQQTADTRGTSVFDVSGTSIVNVYNTSPSYGTATFGRRLRVTGPDVSLTTTGALQLTSTNTYEAVITSPTAHSPLRTDGYAVVNGELHVEFDDGGAAHAFGQTWDLIEADVGILGSFANTGPAGEVSVAGLVSNPPVGALYRAQKVDAVGGEKLLQLLYDRVLVLHVNRDTGELSITNPLAGPIAIDSYAVNSPTGSLLTSYKGISGPPAADTGWTKASYLSPNGLAEYKETGSFDVSAIGASGVTLGIGFDPQAVAADIANFGTDGEDLTFEYATPGGLPLQGQVVYEGTKFANNLVLLVNPFTGAAALKNDSLETLSICGYAIVSATGDLDGSGWTGLGGDWVQASPTATELAETNPIGSLTLAPTEQVSIGDITVGEFINADAQAGLTMQFQLAESLIPVTPGGDYNGDGTVDAADYTVWRDHLGETMTLPNENPPAATPGLVDDEDYLYWKAQFGATEDFGPEPTYRIGSVVFDATLGDGTIDRLEMSAVPEPGTGTLLMIASGPTLLVLLARQRRRRRVFSDQ